MRIDVLTLFPEMFEAVMGTSIIGRARERKLIDINYYNIRDFAENKHKRVDDYPYGGGAGMVMTPQPLFDAFYHVLKNERDASAHVIYFTPQGKKLNNKLAKEYAGYDHLVLLCGHYEGVDQRVIERFVNSEISIGDYVLTGGELPAMVFIDCICRFIPGVLGSSQSVAEESFAKGLLEYPHYTRPQEYEGYRVPDVLLSGNHKEIEKWRRFQSLYITFKKRPDLLSDVELSYEEKKFLQMMEYDEEIDKK